MELIFETDDLDQELAKENIAERLANPSLQQPVANDPTYYNADIYDMGIFRYEGLYLSTPAIYHSVAQSTSEPANTTGFHLLQLMSSRDLRHWQRLGDRKPFIGPSPLGAGAYDLTQILGPSWPVVRNDELWLYYSGFKYRDRPENAEPDVGAICLAVLRRDGWISLDAGEKEGTVCTQPFVLPEGDLQVNVDAGQGALHVDVLDQAQQIVAASEPVTGDQPRGRLTWRQGELRALTGQTIALRFRLSAASLYAYWIES